MLLISLFYFQCAKVVKNIDFQLSISNKSFSLLSDSSPLCFFSLILLTLHNCFLMLFFYVLLPIFRSFSSFSVLFCLLCNFLSNALLLPNVLHACFLKHRLSQNVFLVIVILLYSIPFAFSFRHLQTRQTPTQTVELSYIYLFFV